MLYNCSVELLFDSELFQFASIWDGSVWRGFEMASSRNEVGLVLRNVYVSSLHDHSSLCLRSIFRIAGWYFSSTPSLTLSALMVLSALLTPTCLASERYLFLT